MTALLPIAQSAPIRSSFAVGRLVRDPAGRPRPPADAGTRLDLGAGADLDAGVDDRVRHDHHAVPEDGTGPDDRELADRDPLADRIGLNHGAGVDRRHRQRARSARAA